MPDGDGTKVGQVDLGLDGEEAVDLALGAELGAEVADGHVLVLGGLVGGLAGVHLGVDLKFTVSFDRARF